jgi:hypothetical protein
VKTNDRTSPKQRSIYATPTLRGVIFGSQSQRTHREPWQRSGYIGSTSAVPRAEIIEIFYALSSHKRHRVLSGIHGCVDTGAPRTVSGKRAAKVICSKLGVAFRLQPSSSRFKFAEQICNSLGRISIPLRTPTGTRYFPIEIVDTDIPPLLGLDFMDSMHVTVNTLQNSLDSREGWSLPLTRHDGHIYLRWDDIFQYHVLDGGPAKIASTVFPPERR